MKKQNLSLRITASTLIVAIVVSISPLRMDKAEALIPTFDSANIVQNTITATKQIGQTIKDFKLEPILVKLSAKVLDRMTNSVISWAAGGFKKEGPSFISNFGDFAKSSAIDVASTFVDTLATETENALIQSMSGRERAEVERCAAIDVKYQKMIQGYELLFNDEIQKYNSLKNDGASVQTTVPEDRSTRLRLAGYGDSTEELRRYLEDYYIFSSKPAKDGPIDPTKPGQLTKADEQKIVKDRQNCAFAITKISKGLTYQKELIGFIGGISQKAVRGELNKASLGIAVLPNVRANVAGNWNNWKSDARAGGWEFWESAADIGNTNLGAKFSAQQELSRQVNLNLGEKAAQLARNGGFLDRGVCELSKTLKTGEKICQKYSATTPGNIIREAVAQKVIGQYEDLRNVDTFAELIKVTGAKLATGILREGVLPLANQAIANTFSCGKIKCGTETESPFGLGETNVASSGEQQSNAGNSYDEVVDIEKTLYGEFVVERDVLGEMVYEASPYKDFSGKSIPDYTKPKYVYERDAAGKIQYEKRGGLFLYRDVIDADGQPVLDAAGKAKREKVPKIKREGGIIDLTQKMVASLTEQNRMVRVEGIRALLTLDRALPGPDIGWQDRLTTKVEDISSNIDAEKTYERSIYKEIAQKVRETFDAGANGIMNDDQRDIALVGIPVQQVYTKPEYSFKNFSYSIFDTVPLPEKISLVKVTDNSNPPVASEYKVISMNTFAGVYKNLATGDWEPVGEFPYTTEARDLVSANAETYKIVVDDYKQRIKELRPLLSAMILLEKKYSNLAEIDLDKDGNEIESSKIKRLVEEKKIAYELSQMRTKVPSQDEINEAARRTESIQAGITEMTSLAAKIEGIKLNPTPDQMDRYASLIFKDKLGILYCALQDHSNVNVMDDEARKEVYKIAGEQPPNRISRVKNSPLALMPVAWGVAGLFDRFEKEKNPTFRNEAYTTQREFLNRRQWADTYGQLVPYRCFETSVPCTGSTKCETDTRKPSCPTIGHQKDDEQNPEYHMYPLPISCKSVYRAEVTDYIQYIDPEA